MFDRLIDLELSKLFMCNVSFISYIMSSKNSQDVTLKIQMTLPSR